MTQKRIRAAFEGKLNTWAQAQNLPVIWQNTAQPIPAGQHLRVFLLPAETRIGDLAGKARSYRGLFQITIYALPQTGPSAAETLAPELDTLFPPFVNMTSGGLNVQVVTPMSAHPAIVDTDWYSVPVDCRYRAEEF